MREPRIEATVPLEFDDNQSGGHRPPRAVNKHALAFGRSFGYTLN
jgi:hypothetical protein